MAQFFSLLPKGISLFKNVNNFARNKSSAFPYRLPPKLPPLLLLATPPPLEGITEMLLPPVSATEEVVEVAGAEVALPPFPLPQTIGVIAEREEP